MLTKKCGLVIRLLVFLFSGIIFGQNNLSDFSLNGKVKNVRSVTFLIDNQNHTSVSGFLDSENFDSFFLEFDQKGDLILRENYLDYQGKLGLFDRTIYRFNFNNRIEKSETELIQNGEEPRKISQRRKFYYIQNRLVRIDEFNSGRTTDQFWVTNLIYDGGRLVRKDFWMEDAVFSRTEFTNRLYQVMSEKTFHNDGKAGKSVDYTYGENAKLILKSSQSGNENDEEAFMYENEKLKNHTEKSNGKLIFSTFFNENGLPERAEKFNYRTQKPDWYEFNFEYDFQNNWINCVILENQKPRFIIKRKISYY